MVRSDRTAFLLSLAAFLCLAATQGIFWMFTYPMNVASNNWTLTPGDFEAARQQWEYSHAINAVLTFAALVAVGPIRISRHPGSKPVAAGNRAMAGGRVRCRRPFLPPHLAALLKELKRARR